MVRNLSFASRMRADVLLDLDLFAGIDELESAAFGDSSKVR